MSHKILDRDILIKRQLKPVILGSDINAYGVARTIHENYGIISDVFAGEGLSQTQDSKILRLNIVENFKKKEVFINTLLDFYNKNKDCELVIIPCSDMYSQMLSINEERLKPYFKYNVPSQDLNNKLENKYDFYTTAEQYGIPYPNTEYIDNISQIDFSKLRYPVVLKPENSITFYNAEIQNKKKVYILDNEEDLRLAMKNIYSSEYKDKMILQDFIPGDATNALSMNAYCDQNGKVRMMCLGQILLENPLPLMIGNYNAIYTFGDKELYAVYEDFFNKLGYTGFVNVDLKYDKRDGQYKAFETNLRLGASSYFMVTGGLVHLDFYFRDLLDLGFEEDVYYHDETNKIWLNADPSLLYKYTGKKHHAKIKELLKNGYEFTTWYKADRSSRRFLQYIKRRLGTIKHFKNYGVKPD